MQAFAEAGLPPGVLNFLSTSKETAPALTAEIIAHPLVRKVNVSSEYELLSLVGSDPFLSSRVVTV